MADVATVRARILAAFPDAKVEVSDPRGTSSYFDVYVVSTAFAPMPRVRRHQAVMALFADELRTGEIHALALQTLTPDAL